MGNKKRKKRFSSPKAPQTVNAKLPRVNSANMDTSDDNTLSPVTLNAIMDTLSSLGEKMDNNFKRLREEMGIFKQDLKAEVQVLRNTVSELEMAAQTSSSKIESLEESNKSLSLVTGLSGKRNCYATSRIKEGKRRGFHLEEYSRKENLIFRNVPERPSENCRELIFDIMTKETDIEISQMRCSAVHRMAKSIQGRPRPIIVRFVCREDKEVVFRKRNLLKESIHFPDAYITLEYPSEIKDERAVLIKAMLKAQASGTQAMVIGRTLKIGSASYTSKNVPKELLE